MFQITVRKQFTAEHALKNFKGADEAPHSHDWLLEVCIAAPKLDASGCSIDFGEVDNLLDDILDELLCESLHLSHLFDSPSAENIAQFVFRKLAEKIDDGTRTVVKVTISEDEDHAASYYE